jgi:hypothetical protein
MEIYVQSRGFSQAQDYRWLRINKDGTQVRENPPLLDEVENLIDSESPTVVIARSNQRLLLLVTELDSAKRTDVKRRPIRNNIAWVGKDSDEPVLRALAARALRGELSEEIDRAVESGGDQGFQVNFSDIQKLESAVRDKAKNSSPDPKRKIESNLANKKKYLADELEQYSLPIDNKPLVVVTGTKKREILENAGVWRGLSNDGGLVYPPPPPNRHHDEIIKNIQNFLKCNWWSFTIILIVIPVAAIGFGILNPSNFYSKSEPNPNPTPTIQPTVIPSTASITPNQPEKPNSNPTTTPTAEPSKAQFTCQANTNVSGKNKDINIKVTTFNLKDRKLYIQMWRFEPELKTYKSLEESITANNWKKLFPSPDEAGSAERGMKYYISASLDELTPEVAKQKQKQSEKCLAEASGESCFVCIIP